MPTENLKFTKFIDLIFKSKMEKEHIKSEIVKYVTALETNYNETIRELKDLLGKEKTKSKKLNFQQVEETSGKN